MSALPPKRTSTLSSFTSYKLPLCDLTGVRQSTQQLHLSTNRAKCVGIEVEDAQRVCMSVVYRPLRDRDRDKEQNAPCPLRSGPRNPRLREDGDSLPRLVRSGSS